MINLQTLQSAKVTDPTAVPEKIEADTVDSYVEDNEDTQEAEVIDDNRAPDDIPQELWDRWKRDDSHVDHKDDVDRALDLAGTGAAAGIPTSLQALDRHLHGITKGRYYLIGAESGAGKTTFADFVFVFKAWENAKKVGKKVKILYFSFEIGLLEKKFRWISYIIFLRYGVRLPSFYLQGHVYGKPLTAQHKIWAKEAKFILEQMMKDIAVIEDTLHPTAVYQIAIDCMEQMGTITREKLNEDEVAAKKKPRILGYKVHKEHENTVPILMIDHLALTGHELGLTTKGVMDKMSRYAIILRNMFGMSIAFLQQFSTEMMAAQREAALRKGDVSALTPQRLDFGDSKATYRDADVVIALSKPPMELKSYYDYKLKLVTSAVGEPEGLGNNFTACHIIKHRYGSANRMVPLLIDGSVGMIYGLPTQGASQEFIMQEYYNIAKEIEDLCQVYSPQKD